jgi:L-fuculose-phosphate aldolase
MDIPLWQLKKQFVDIGHRLWLRGYCAGNEGNISARLSDDRVLCTPTGVSKGFLVPDDLCLIDMDGEMVETNPRGRKRTSEIKMHVAIYRHRPDVKVVVHCHPPHATAFAFAGVTVPAGIYPEGEVFLGRVPLVPYATPGTSELAESVLPVIDAETNTVLMGNHGSVSFSPVDLSDGYYKVEILDAYCRILLLARQLGNVNTLSNDQIVDLLKVKRNFGMEDSRLACAADGCVADDNDSFFAAFDVRPATATCDCQGTVRREGAGADAASQPDSEQAFEKMVQVITDQIMAAAGN